MLAARPALFWNGKKAPPRGTLDASFRSGYRPRVHRCEGSRSPKLPRVGHLATDSVTPRTPNPLGRRLRGPPSADTGSGRTTSARPGMELLHLTPAGSQYGIDLSLLAL